MSTDKVHELMSPADWARWRRREIHRSICERDDTTVAELLELEFISQALAGCFSDSAGDKIGSPRDDGSLSVMTPTRREELSDQLEEIAKELLFSEP